MPSTGLKTPSMHCVGSTKQERCEDREHQNTGSGLGPISSTAHGSQALSITAVAPKTTHPIRTGKSQKDREDRTCRVGEDVGTEASSRPSPRPKERRWPCATHSSVPPKVSLARHQAPRKTPKTSQHLPSNRLCEEYIPTAS